MAQNPNNIINSIKESALKWLIGACVSLVVFIQVSSYKKIDSLDTKIDLLLSQINNNTIDIEVLKNKIQNLEKKTSVNYPITNNPFFTLFKPEEEIKYNFKPTENETN